MFLVDSHCHLDYDPMISDIQGTLERAHVRGVKGFLTICTELSKIPLIKEIADKHSEVYGSIGIHPHEAQEAPEEEDLVSLLIAEAQHPKIIGFGETGLDYYYKNSPIKDQKASFRAHIQAAVECDLPLIVHTRDAEEDTIDLLKSVGKGKARGLIHCFTGSDWLRDQALSLGFYISASGIMTFKKSDSLRETLKEVPLDRLLVETDAPFLAPEPHRGKPNEPAYVADTAIRVADLKGVSFETLSTQTTQNFLNLFTKAKL